jgi:hypothetical protein
LSGTDTQKSEPELKPVKLGKNIELRYIPFSELAIPWNVCLDTAASKQQKSGAQQSRFFHFRQVNPKNPKASKILKEADLEELARSIAKYGLLKPFEVAEMYERLDFFYGKGKYLVIDGQRRYFAIRELLKLPSENDEGERKESLRTGCDQENVMKGEMQAQQEFDELSIRNYVLIPCLVYPYTTLLQMVRHSIEDKRFSEKPLKQDREFASKMAEEGIRDLVPDDLRELWKTRDEIEEERESIEKTLKEISTRLQKQPEDFAQPECQNTNA